MITRPQAFNDQLRAANPLPDSGTVEIEEALRKLAEIVSRDGQRFATDQPKAKARYRPPTACVGM